MNCREWRRRRENQPAGAGLAPAAAEHLRDCAACAEYERLRGWSGELLRRGALEAPPAPSFAALWAAIQRATQPRWELALSLSFRRLAPFLVALSLLLLLVGAMAPRQPNIAASSYTSPLLVAGPGHSANLAPDLSRQGDPEAVLVATQP